MSDHPFPVSPSREGILAGGNFITDYVKLIDVWPEQDTLASIRSESMCNGGGPYNLLKDLARLAPDLPREACGLVGHDLNGDCILSDCRRAGIDVTQIHRTDQASTSYTDAMTVTSTGRRTFFHQRGANSLLSPEHFDFASTNARIFLLGYLMLLDRLDEFDDDDKTGSARVLANARKSGLIAAVDCVSEPSPRFRDVVLSSLAESDILFINEFEIGQVIGREVSPQRESMIEAAHELAKQCKRANTQIVLHAAKGAVVVTPAGTVETQSSLALPANQIAGASGAGDAFAAGYLLGVHESKSTGECLRFAVSAAGMSLTDPTPSAGMQTLEQCLAMEEEFGHRDF